MLIIRAGIYKMLVRIAKTGKTLIRLLLQKQSDLGLRYLSGPVFGRQLVFNILKYLLSPIVK